MTSGAPTTADTGSSGAPITAATAAGGAAGAAALATLLLTYNNPSIVQLSNLERLDQEYESLDDMEAELLRAWNQSRVDEVQIRNAANFASETAAERKARETAKRNEAAIKRLENALMGEGDSESDID